MCTVVLILGLLSEPALSMMLAPCLFASVKGGTSEKGGFATEERDGANASNMNQLFAGSRAFTDKRRSKACAHSIVSDYRLQLRAASNRYTSAIGRSSTQHMDQHFLLKKNGDPVMARREECILSLLRREPWVPELVCPLFEGELLLRKAGQPLDHTNLPRSWRTQVERITAGLRSHGIAHNDIWKTRFRPGRKPLMAELVVERDTITLLDFNTATINGSFAVCQGMTDAYNNKGDDGAAWKGGHGWQYKIHMDARVLYTVLNAMVAANQTIERYRTVGINAQLGWCRATDAAGLDDAHQVPDLSAARQVTDSDWRCLKNATVIPLHCPSVLPNTTKWKHKSFHQADYSELCSCVCVGRKPTTRPTRPHGLA